MITKLSHETAPTQFVDAGEVRLAYRRFGKSETPPLVFFQYFAANMDSWDPLLINSLATDRDVILVNNAGVASSEGDTPASVLGLSNHAVAFIRALGLDEVDLFGFSLGGMIAQQLMLDHPGLVRKSILLGTGPRGGEGMTYGELSIEEARANPEQVLLKAFFSPSDASQAAGKALLERLQSRKEQRDPLVSVMSARAQLAALLDWGQIPSQDRYATLQRIKQPTLIVHGNRDPVVSPINALILAQHLPNAQLIVYPDSGHAAQSQHADAFLRHAKLFLDS